MVLMKLLLVLALVAFVATTWALYLSVFVLIAIISVCHDIIKSV
jgi:hypothetical protein